MFGCLSFFLKLGEKASILESKIFQVVDFSLKIVTWALQTKEIIFTLLHKISSSQKYITFLK